MADVIYLDLLHWIGLSKARLGADDAGGYADLLSELRSAVEGGTAVVPLAFPHYIELSQQSSAQKRADVALTMVELLGHAALASREALMYHDFRLALATELGTTYNAIRPAVIGYGLAYAFGQPPLKVPLEDHPRAFKVFAAQPRRFIERLEAHTGYGWKFHPSGTAESSLELVREALDAHMQFRLLMGPANMRDPALVKAGFNPSSAYEVVERMRRREADLAERLDAEPQWQKRLDDIIEARALFWDLAEEWDRAVSDVWRRIISYEEFGWERVHRILRSIPAIDIESSIRHVKFRERSRGWKTNDIHDLGFAGTAIANCQVVAADKQLCSQACRQHLDRRYGTVIVAKPDQLTNFLRGQRQNTSEDVSALPVPS